MTSSPVTTRGRRAKGEAEKVVGFIHPVNLVGHTGAKESEGDGEKREICRKKERERERERKNCKFTQYCYLCVKELAFSVPLKNYVCFVGTSL